MPSGVLVSAGEGMEEGMNREVGGERNENRGAIEGYVRRVW